MADEVTRTGKLCLWDEKEQRYCRWVEVPVERTFFTVSGLHQALEKLMDQRPDFADLPVHILGMNPENEGFTGGLITDIETDVNSSEQGLVLSLMSWPTRLQRTGGATL